MWCGGTIPEIKFPDILYWYHEIATKSMIGALISNNIKKLSLENMLQYIALAITSKYGNEFICWAPVCVSNSTLHVELCRSIILSSEQNKLMFLGVLELKTAIITAAVQIMISAHFIG